MCSYLLHLIEFVTFDQIQFVPLSLRTLLLIWIIWFFFCKIMINFSFWGELILQNCVHTCWYIWLSLKPNSVCPSFPQNTLVNLNHLVLFVKLYRLFILGWTNPSKFCSRLVHLIEFETKFSMPPFPSEHYCQSESRGSFLHFLVELIL